MRGSKGLTMGTESAAGGPGGVPAARLVRRVEERLERLLESGWRNAGQEASQLTEEAEALALAGMERLAQRLREVAAAKAAADGLAAVTVALAACRLLRARLAPNPRGGRSEERRGGSEWRERRWR